MSTYKQTIRNNKILREFSNDVDSHELVWHRDKKDRIVKILEGNNWKFQLDNKLPVTLTEGMTIFIPKQTYHRILKGSNNLKIEIKEV